MKKVLGRLLLVIPAIGLQIYWYYLILHGLDEVMQGHLGNLIDALFSVLAVLFVLSLVSKRDESSYKLLWVIVILTMPILGAMLYLFLGNKNTGRGLKKKLQKSAEFFSVGDYASEMDLSDEIIQDDRRLGQIFQHVYKTTGFPVLKNGTSKYYPFGEEMFADMCRDLKKAEKFIFIEYFIIERGKFWDTITDILAEKAAAGVDVRVMYDDVGSLATYSYKNIRELTSRGIRCTSFNPLFFITTQLNNRDHRKIMVIDGRVAYSGGVNLADEYINEKLLFGKWKDIGFRLTGAGIASYTYMFAEFWNAFSPDKIDREAFRSLSAEKNAPPLSAGLNDAGDKAGALVTSPGNGTDDRDNGYILPYYDSPSRDDHTSNVVYTEILSLATDYVWFYTPYLMLGDALFDAFIRAASRGVDVRIIMPGIPDKKVIFRLSRSYYGDLVKAGVKIYEYTPGFVHAKAVIADDKVAAIGTVNLDYRSLFLHFECNSLFYRADIVESLKQDYLNTLEQCRERTPDSLNTGHIYRLTDSLLRVLAPLL